MRSGARIFDRNSAKPTRGWLFYLLPDGRAKTSSCKLQIFQTSDRTSLVILAKNSLKIFVRQKKIISITIKKDK